MYMYRDTARVELTMAGRVLNQLILLPKAGARPVFTTATIALTTFLYLLTSADTQVCISFLSLFPRELQESARCQSSFPSPCPILH
jgi:hypothetical protein